MRAALHRVHGAPGVIEVVDVPEPEVGSRDVLIAVRTAALNRLDVLQRQGPALVPGFELPHIAGMDVAGEVLAIGDHVTTVAVGDRVLVNPALNCGECAACQRGDDAYCANGTVVGANRPGGFAERVAVPATHVHPIPDDVGYDEAATIPTIYSTAWRGLFGVGQLRLGETVVIHGASSGVSTAAIQLAKRAGATVVATARSTTKVEVAAKLGADVCLDTSDEGWVGAARAATGGRGADMVFDHVGAALFQASLQALRARGRLVFCGSTSGGAATFDLPYAYHFGLRLLGVDSYSREEFAEMLDHYWTGGYQPVVDSEHSLADLAMAQARLESGEAIGKVLIHP